jgi:GntR family transcriptional regulator
MIPFRIPFKSGQPVYEQVVFAVKKALVAGALQTGDRFPSVRQLSQELKINPNTAHKVVASLVQERILEVVPGIGTIVAEASVPDKPARQKLLGEDIERLVVESSRLSLGLDDLIAAVTREWRRINKASQ